MRKLLQLAASAAFGVALLAPGGADAALTNFEPFDYTPGASLNGQAGGTGWNGGWFTTGTSQNNTLAADPNSLSYPTPFQAPMATPSTTGTRVSTGGLTANASNSRLLASTIPLNVDGTVAYASALVRKNVANGGIVTSDNILLEFTDAAGNRRWGFGIEGTGDKPWLNANGSTTPPTGATVTPGDTYFLVTKIVSSASGTDQAFLKVYGTGYGSEVPVAEPTTWDATLTQTTGAILDRLRIRIDTGNTETAPGEVDEIRIGTDWSSVVPEPAAGAILALGLLGLAARRRRA